MEDGPYCMMIELLAEKTAVVNEILYRYRLYSASTTGGVIKKRGKPKIPYNCLKTAIETVQKNTADPVTLQMLEYCSLKIMAGWLTNIYKNVDKETRRELCSYCRNIIYTFFPNVSHNPYIGLKKLPKLPVSHQAAVRMLLTAYQTNTVYPFSLISSGLLKLKH